jgi:FkbM family methyltransferase
VHLSIPVDDGETVEFDCPDNWVSRWVCEAILQDKTYPHLPFVDDVAVVLDVGANCGAATVHFARHHPGATVHAFEPGAEARGYLERNTAAYPGVQVHPVGLWSEDAEVPLYPGDDDLGKASIIHRSVNLDTYETVQVRAAGAWAAEHAIDRIDVLKVDVEGCEVEVLESLGPLLATVKVLYVEYDSRQARRRIEELVAETHELYFAMLMALDQGECIYVAKELADHDEAVPTLRRIAGFATS